MWLGGQEGVVFEEGKGVVVCTLVSGFLLFFKLDLLANFVAVRGG